MPCSALIFPHGCSAPGSAFSPPSSCGRFSRPRLERIRQDAVRQIVLADDALHTALQSYSASEALVAAAQKTFDSALNSYRSGEGTVTDLNLAQTQLLQAKNASADSHATALSAAATLAFATRTLGEAPKWPCFDRDALRDLVRS
jgi:outer membrane protein TolC